MSLFGVVLTTISTTEMEKHRKFCGAFLVGLSEADSKKYRLILDSRKRDPIEMAASSDMSIISQDDPKDNNKNDYYKGKTVVKRLQRSCSRTFSLEEKQKIVAAYQSGKFCHELGNEYKCSKTTIIKLLRQQGVDVRKDKARAKINDKVVIEMYGQMATVAQIAKHFGVNPQIITRCLREHGVKIRTRWDYPQK